jgi:hypothetical protein
MHNIKYFFSIKIIRQCREGKKISEEEKLPKILQKNTIFQNSGGTTAPWTHMDLHLYG